MIDGKQCEYNVPETKLFPPSQSEVNSPTPGSLQVYQSLDVSEQRALLYFRERTTADLNGFTSYTHTFWNSLIPGLCQSEPAIRHIVIALATKHEALRSDVDRAAEINPFCIKHHSLALQTLTRPTIPHNEEILLVSCIAFITFERLQDPCGTIGSYLTYIVAGLKILRERERTRSAQIDDGYSFNLVDHFIEPMFFQIQLVISMFCEPARLVCNNEPQVLSAYPDIPTTFEDVHDARHALFRICVWRYIISYKGEEWSGSSPGFQKVRSLLTQWHDSLAVLERSFPESEIEDRKKVGGLRNQAQILVGAMLYSARDGVPKTCYGHPTLVYLSMPTKIAIFTRISESRKINLAGINGGLSPWPHAKRVSGPTGENFVVLELSTSGAMVRE